MAECLDIRADDVSALVFPFTHIGGIGWLIASLLTGCTLLTTEAFVEGEVAAGVSVETAAELDPQAVASRSRPTAANRGSGITNPDRRGAPFR